MKVSVSIEDGNETFQSTIDLSEWPVMEHEIRLLHTFMPEGLCLARTFIQLVTLGIDVALGVYSKEMLKKRKWEIEQLIKKGPKPQEKKHADKEEL